MRDDRGRDGLFRDAPLFPLPVVTAAADWRPIPLAVAADTIARVNRRELLRSAAAAAALAAVASSDSLLAAPASTRRTTTTMATTKPIPDDLTWHDVRDWG